MNETSIDKFLGRSFGPYRVVSLLGKGGMGAVYLAEDSRLERRVALKLLPADGFPDPDRVQRFQREARAASALNHPNIIAIYDFDNSDGVYFIASELVEGRTLREVIKQGKTPLSEILNLATQITSALVAAHAAGIVHRDIKPENIMVRSDGYVKVLDFGLAKLHEAGRLSQTTDLGLTIPGQIIGTAQYMSPEQARGARLDPRTDLFSLGAVLYELAARHAAFAGSTQADVIAAIVGQEPAPLARLAPECAALDPVVRKCLRKDREHRYQTAQDLLADLKQIQTDLQTPRRQRNKTFWIGAAVAALLAVAAGGYFATRLASPEPFLNSRLTQIPGTTAFSTGVISADARYIAYVDTRPDGNRTLNLRLLNGPAAIELIPPAFVTYNALAFSADGTFLYYTSSPARPHEPSALFRIPVLGGGAQKLANDVSGKIAVSPDGSSVALVRRQRSEGTLSIMAADGTAEHELLHRRADFPFQSVEWSPDSRAIFFVEAMQGGGDSSSSIYLINRSGGTPRLVTQPAKTFIYDLVALPGGGFLANAFDRDAGLQQIWHISHSGVMRHITHDLSQYQGLSASRDRKQILTSQVQRHSELWVVDRDNPSLTRRITEVGRRYDTPTWSHSGSIIASRFEVGNWMLWTIPRDGPERPLIAQSGTDINPNACPDRDDIVFSSARKGGYAVWRILPDGSGLKQLTPGSNDRYPQCVAGGTVLYWLMTGSQRKSMQVPLDGGPTSPSESLSADQLVSPDGRFVLSAFLDEKTGERRLAVRTRDLRTTMATYPYGGRAAAMAWSPDSRGFADARGPRFAKEIWYQPVPSGPARQLTHFGEDSIFDVSWSPDGRQLVCSRGNFRSDLVLISERPQ